MKFKELRQAIDTAWKETLTSAGFRRTKSGAWNRRIGDNLNVVQLQKHSTKELFCVNLGVHYAFLPKSGTGAPLDGDNIEPPDCELKLRLTEQASVNDQWWPVAAASVNQVAELVTSRGFEIFNSYRIEGELSAMNATHIESGNPGLLARITEVRAYLLLALMHERLGNRDKCIEAASIGVKLAGIGAGSKKALMEILKRCGQPD